MRQVIGLFLLALSVSAQSEDLASRTAQNLVSGQVIDGYAGSGVAGAQVYLRSTASKDILAYVTVSSPEGRFTLTGITPGTYTLGVLHDSYVPTQWGATLASSSTPLIIGPDQTIKDLRVQLTRPGVTFGRILDENNTPVAFARVQAITIRYFNGIRHLTAAQQSSTNDLGEFRMAGLAPGSYILSASHPGRRRMVSADRIIGTSEYDAEFANSYAETFYPASLTANLAQKFELGSNSQLGPISIRLVRSKQSKIAGTVRGANGLPSRNTLIQLWPLDSEGKNAGVGKSIPLDNANGNFEFSKLPPGGYLVGARSSGMAGREEQWTPISLGTEPADVQITLHSSRDLSIHLVNETGAPLSPGTQLVLEGAAMQSRLTAPIDSGGNGTASGIAPDRYAISLNTADADAFIQSLRWTGQNAADPYFTVPITGDVPELTVVLTRNGGVVDGKVKGLQGGGTVVLIPEAAQRQTARLFKSIKLESDGSFSFRGVAPGEYKLFA